ncbi:pilin [Uruburuella testudinis]|uniref:Pilin n=1 Tax=Uruburuella testudinis TaxID=1282863 RepID=A0ABY4E0F1_9NEIS|nr:pilin [Uruburuella testudinis]
MAASLKVEVEAAYADTGSLPINAAISQRGGNAGNYVDRINVDNNSGVITATISQQAATPIQGLTVTLTPGFTVNDQQGNTSWVCGGTVPDNFLPVSCK